uniref:E3 ubiquitin-protein ligase n=1 Tax=Gigaspora margarita TaxID=4874 RepID=A0A8H4B3K0_GIGMA
MVCVHENFRCILVLNEKDVFISDPPLLNRFEKQRMTMSDIIDDDMESLLKTLKEWSKQISTLVNVEKDIASKFNENDIFIGFDKEETLQSLVIHNFNNNSELKDEILHKCKELLIGIALPDGIVRSKKSMLSNNEIDYWHNFYFQQDHEDLPSYIRSLLRDAKNARGFSSIIYTFSNVNTDIESCLKKILNCQVDKLSTFNSETQFRSRVKHFWLESRDNILILQCDMDAANSECIKLAKFIIEQYKKQFMASKYSATQTKHVCIILHLRKENLISTISSFNFMCGWDLFTLETLTPQEHSLKVYLDKDLMSILKTVYKFEDVVDCELIWCLTRLDFPPSYQSADYIKSLAQKIPHHKQFMNWMKDRTIEYLHNNQFKDWQLEVAINKKYLYLCSSFSIALQTYINHQVREPIARLLYALEKLSGLLILDSDDLFHEANKNCNEDNDEENDATFTSWEPIIMDTEIVNIKNIKAPYILTDSLHGLKLPFSRYFMKQINKFRSIYQDDLMIERVPDNIDEKTGNLKSHIIDNCIEKFSEHLISIVPVLKLPQIKFPNLYFNDFTTIVSHGKTDKSQILRRIISYNMGQEVPDPIRLHVFWWENEDLILNELQLVLLFPSNIDEILNTKFDESQEFNFANYLLKRLSDIMINQLCAIIDSNCKKDNNIGGEDDYLDDKGDEQNSNTCNENSSDQMQIELQHWQRYVANILSIACNLSNSIDNPSLNVLRAYNDLSKTIPLAQMHQIRRHATDLFSEQSLNIIFRMLDHVEKTEINLFSRRSFIYRCLNMISCESPIRSHLYTIIFSKESSLFTFHIIYLIFESENEAQDGLLFFNIINNPEILKNTKRLQVIENILSSQKDSEMAALCCDAIQMHFTDYLFDELSNYILKAINILINNSKELQKITAISLLKLFANEFWNHTEFNSNSFKFKFENDNISINDLNKCLKKDHPLIHSFTIYLIKSLYLKGLTTYQIQQFCAGQQQILPWLRVLKADCDSRLGFNPYFYIEQYNHVDYLFKIISYCDELSDIFNEMVGDNEIARKIALAGIIITKFYLIRASRELNANGNISIQKISKYLQSSQSSQLPEHYKMYLLNFMTNNHKLYKLSPNIKNADVFISSVVAHIVALNSSSSVNSSPLAAYMQALNDYKDTYILTCPSDELASITNIIIANDSGTRRYQCKCGNFYFVNRCGRPKEKGDCDQCKNKIGGLDHILNEGSSSIDEDKIERSIAVNDKQGYIIEDTFDTYYNVRTLHPASYRIIHLFLHIIIGIQAHLPTTVAFINNHSIDIVQYCKKHIENDWNVLKSILNCDDETLSLVIHSILSDMLQEPQKNVEKFILPAQREAWEECFSQKYVLPRIKNVRGTANNFRVALDKNANNLLEINETTEIACQYLPRLWRLVRKPDLDNFKS